MPEITPSSKSIQVILYQPDPFTGTLLPIGVLFHQKGLPSRVILPTQEPDNYWFGGWASAMIAREAIAALRSWEPTSLRLQGFENSVSFGDYSIIPESWGIVEISTLIWGRA